MQTWRRLRRRSSGLAIFWACRRWWDDLTRGHKDYLIYEVRFFLCRNHVSRFRNRTTTKGILAKNMLIENVTTAIGFRISQTSSINWGVKMFNLPNDV